MSELLKRLGIQFSLIEGWIITSAWAWGASIGWMYAFGGAPQTREVVIAGILSFIGCGVWFGYIAWDL